MDECLELPVCGKLEYALELVLKALMVSYAGGTVLLLAVVLDVHQQLETEQVSGRIDFAVEKIVGSNVAAEVKLYVLPFSC